MEYKCQICNKYFLQRQITELNCLRHVACRPCYKISQKFDCVLCQSGIIQEVELNNFTSQYPIQGMMINYHKSFNPWGQSEFSGGRTCRQRTAGWITLLFLAVIFFFSGLAMAIGSDEKGYGVIMTILGIVGIFFAIFFIFKIKKIDRQYDSNSVARGDNFIYLKKQDAKKSEIISSVSGTPRY